MKCSPTDVPTPEAIDIEAIKAKYRQERDRRMRNDGQKQYEQPVEDFADNYAADPHKTVQARDAITEEIDVAVLGAGWSGILSAVHLKKAGVQSILNIDHAGDFGGVWYWNRYPGVQDDNDAYCYLPMLEEMDFLPSQKFADGAEIYAYMRSIAERFDLYQSALFHTLLTAMRWDQEIHRWRISTNRGDEILARFVIMANGLLNLPKLPGVEGIHSFKGKMFHTARWDYDYTGGSETDNNLTKLGDKRVALIGTGATAIQAIPQLARSVKQLYVLQRTPPSVDARPNPPTSTEWAKSLQPGWQQERIANFHRAAMEQLLPGEEDLICDFWTEIGRNLNAELEAEGWPELTLEEFVERRTQMDFRVMERMRRRVESMVEDKETAEALKPWYRFPCKRPLSNDEYYTTFNRPNVDLIDVSATQGVERMTKNGFVANGVEYDIDCMIFASGFEVTSDLDRRWGIATIEGRDGKSIYDHWADGYQTLHGVMSHGFPNWFFIGLYQGGLNATMPELFNRQSQHIAYVIKTALARDLAAVEPSEDAQNDYVRHVRETAIDVSELQRECTPSYLNNEGEARVGADGEEKRRWYLGEIYGLGWNAFQELLQEWRDKDELEGLVITEAQQ
ncbi:MAG: flavin-containing monooxygenase [Pseudomonadales bacterium]